MQYSEKPDSQEAAEKVCKKTACREDLDAGLIAGAIATGYAHDPVQNRIFFLCTLGKLANGESLLVFELGDLTCKPSVRNHKRLGILCIPNPSLLMKKLEVGDFFSDSG